MKNKLNQRRGDLLEFLEGLDETFLDIIPFLTSRTSGWQCHTFKSVDTSGKLLTIYHSVRYWKGHSLRVLVFQKGNEDFASCFVSVDRTTNITVKEGRVPILKALVKQFQAMRHYLPEEIKCLTADVWEDDGDEFNEAYERRLRLYDMLGFQENEGEYDSDLFLVR